jgi:hypothetical protein
MKPPNEQQAAPEIIELLAEMFGGPPSAVRLKSVGAAEGYDYDISVGSHRFSAEYRVSATAGSVASAIECLRRAAERLPLVIVPFMGQVGQHLCDQARISWLDLSGNARIVGPGLRIRVEGRPNKYLGRGRPPNVFASKSSRIARQLLLNPHEFQTQAELARKSRLGDGYVSKIVRRLGQEQYLEANDEGGVRPRDPDLLLDAWREAYDFNRQRMIKGHVPARSGGELLQRVVKCLLRSDLRWAVTGLSAAWTYTQFAAFRLATIYLSSMPSRSLLGEMTFLEEAKGANLWLVLPDDDGVFDGSQIQDDIRCVSALQTYLDLKDHPERAKDAADELRRKRLNWGPHEP